MFYIYNNILLTINTQSKILSCRIFTVYAGVGIGIGKSIVHHVKHYFYCGVLMEIRVYLMSFFSSTATNDINNNYPINQS